MTQQAEPSIWVKKNNPAFLECNGAKIILMFKIVAA